MTPTEREAEAYADSIDRRGCAFWQGMYRGYIAGHDKARNQAIQECVDIVSVTPGDENVISKLESLLKT